MAWSTRRVWALVAVGATVAVLAWTGSAAAQAGELDQLGWMAGCWEADLNGSLWEEQWMEPRGDVMSMMSRTSRDGTVRAWEFGLVRRDSLGLVFRAFPSGQEATDFRAASASEEAVVFLNPEHDFPRRIQYRSDGPDRMVTGVYREVEGANLAFQLDFRRVACPGLASPRPGHGTETRGGDG